MTCPIFIKWQQLITCVISSIFNVIKCWMTFNGPWWHHLRKKFVIWIFSWLQKCDIDTYPTFFQINFIELIGDHLLWLEFEFVLVQSLGDVYHVDIFSTNSEDMMLSGIWGKADNIDRSTPINIQFCCQLSPRTTYMDSI